MKRIVVTGMGVVSPLGNGVETFWRALCAGESGIGALARLDAARLDYKQAAEVRTLPPPHADGGGTDLANRFAAAAAAEAIRSAGWDPSSAGAQAGVVLATNFGGVNSAEPALGRAAPPDSAALAGLGEYPFQRAVDLIAAHHGLGGPRVALSLSCSSGAAAIGYATDLIRLGRASAVLAGGYDALSLFAWCGLSCLRTMTREKLRPFDKTRNGTIFGEGAAVLLLEDAGAARARGAPALAEVAGHGMNNNGFHMTAPDKDGLGTRLVMEMALADAGMEPGEIDHVNAHATGTKYNDVTETQAIKAVFGRRAYDIPVNGIKSMTGHTMGAAGALEAVASVLSLRDGRIPPTLNLETPDPECDLNYVPHRALAVPLRAVLSNSAGIGGCNAALVFRKAGAA